MASSKSPTPEFSEEPSLEELMADPIVQLIMQRDKVNAQQMRGEIDRVRSAFLVA